MSKGLSLIYTNGKVVVNNLNWVTIKDHEQIFDLVRKAAKNRTTDKTSWNER